MLIIVESSAEYSHSLKINQDKHCISFFLFRLYFLFRYVYTPNPNIYCRDACVNCIIDIPHWRISVV